MKVLIISAVCWDSGTKGTNYQHIDCSVLPAFACASACVVVKTSRAGSVYTFPRSHLLTSFFGYPDFGFLRPRSRLPG